MFNSLPYLVQNFIIDLCLYPFVLDEDDDEYDYRNEIHMMWRHQLGMVSWSWFNMVSKKLADFTLSLRNKKYAKQFSSLLNGKHNQYSMIQQLHKLSLYRVFRDCYISFLSGDELLLQQHHHHHHNNNNINNNNNDKLILYNKLKEINKKNKKNYPISPLNHLKIVDDVEMTMLWSIMTSKKFPYLEVLELEVHGWENDGHEIGIFANAIAENTTIREYNLVFHEYGSMSVMNRERYLPLVRAFSSKTNGQFHSISLMMTIDGLQTISEVFGIPALKRLAITTSASDPNLLSLLSEQISKNTTLKECRIKLTSTASMPSSHLLANQVAQAFYLNNSINILYLSSLQFLTDQFFQALENNRSIQKLVLNQCINDTLVESLCTMLVKNQTIRNLRLIEYAKCSDPEGVNSQLFANALAENQFLYSLRMDSCDLISDRLFLNIGSRNKSLHYLSLHECIKQSHMHSLSTMLRENKTLTSLSINYNDLKDDSYFCEALATNTTLQQLDISSNEFKMDCIFRALAKSDSIENLIYYSFHGYQQHETMESFNHYKQTTKSLKYINGRRVHYT